MMRLSQDKARRLMMEVQMSRYADPIAFWRKIKARFPLPCFLDYDGLVKPVPEYQIFEGSHHDWMLWLDPSLAKGVLTYLAATQATAIDPAADAQPGKILHELLTQNGPNLLAPHCSPRKLKTQVRYSLRCISAAASSNGSLPVLSGNDASW